MTDGVLMCVMGLWHVRWDQETCTRESNEENDIESR